MITDMMTVYSIYSCSMYYVQTIGIIKLSHNILQFVQSMTS